MNPIPRAALLDLVRGLTNKTSTQWSSEPDRYQKGKWFELSILAYGANGVDEIRRETVGDELDTSVSGVRRFTLSILARSLEAKSFPFDMLEEVRIRLRGSSARAILKRECLALIDFPGQIQNAPWRIDSREGLAAVMDVRFAMASTSNENEGAGGIIETTTPIVGTAT